MNRKRRIGKGTFVGMGAIVLNGADISEYALVGAGSHMTECNVFPYTLFTRFPCQVGRKIEGSRFAANAVKRRKAM